MSDPIIKAATEGNSGHFTTGHMIFAIIIAGLTGGFFNPVLKIAAKYWPFKLLFKKKDKDDVTSGEAAIKVAEIKKEEKTEGKLWERVERLELNLKEEIEKRLKSEKSQNNLLLQVEELKRERLFTLSRYIHLKLRVEEAAKEIEYLKSKLREKDPDFDKDYPKFSVDSDLLTDEKLINEIVKETN